MLQVAGSFIVCLFALTGVICELQEPHADIQRIPSDGRVVVDFDAGQVS